LQDIHLVNNSVPELDLSDISTSVCLAGKTLDYPIIINALTGGTDEAFYINQELARLAKEYGLAMAVGSQAIAFSDDTAQDTFSIVRDVNPDGLLLANLSAMSSPEEADQAVQMIKADAIQLHFNVGQELAMREGDRCFRGILDNVAQIVEKSAVPVIAKEVGFGFSREAVGQLYQAGVRIFDTGGKGGTNFIAIEDQREGLFQGQLDDWGIATASSLAEIAALKLPITIIASGGIRDACDIGKALALGANLAGMASPLLKTLIKGGPEWLATYMEGLLYRLKAVFLMAGARDCQQLRNCPVVITGETAAWLRARGIDPHWWAERRGN
jgi:isopentenyl-diphosphate delta-isomerase